MRLTSEDVRTPNPRLRVPALTATILAGCAGSRPGPAVGRAQKTTGKARRVSIKTTLAFASGSQFLAPAGWWVAKGSTFEILEGPQREQGVVLLEIPGREPVEAIAAAQRRVRTDFGRKIEPTLPPDGLRARP